jgi:hypothetical protein
LFSITIQTTWSYAPGEGAPEHGAAADTGTGDADGVGEVDAGAVTEATAEVVGVGELVRATPEPAVHEARSATSTSSPAPSIERRMAAV